MAFERSSGILLHPSSLPGPYGIGDLGPSAYRWLDFLESTGTRLWQILPLGPTGYADSPYQTFSAFAGNPYLISPDLLLEDGLLHPHDLASPPNFDPGAVDYGQVIFWKMDLLHSAYNQAIQSPGPILDEAREFYREQNWLDDYATFMALKEFHGWGSWTGWQAPLRDRDPGALAAFRDEHSYAIERQQFYQFLFHRQWRDLRHHANQKGIRIIGDIPIFIAHDSADAWSRPELLYLDSAGNPTVVAGVPPDYFSETGQLWGNPLYRWEVHARDGYRWWLDRLGAVLELVDYVRLDHFRGFAGYWEIPAEEKTAINGRWVPGPGAHFLEAAQQVFNPLPIIAEDLGEITPDVIELRDQFKLPGMKILVFAFDSGETNLFLPHLYPENCVVYTGTHDNDTVLGWFKRVDQEERDFALEYLDVTGEDISWDLIRAAWESRAVFAIAPLQDLLGLDNSARMNYPGNPQGNWVWRVESAEIWEALTNKLSALNEKTGRDRG